METKLHINLNSKSFMTIDSAFQDRRLSVWFKCLFQGLHETERSNPNNRVILRVFSHLHCQCSAWKFEMS